jgi:hypothetical protein
VADLPLRTAIDHRLGKLLPHQLANQPSTILSAPGSVSQVPSFPPQRLCGISLTFVRLSPSNRYVSMYYSPVRHSPSDSASTIHAAVRLACVKHAASVQSEPGSNSFVPNLSYLFCRFYGFPYPRSIFLFLVAGYSQLLVVIFYKDLLFGLLPCS